jgi:hypothetical protein
MRTLDYALHLIWRIGFFPFAMLGLFIVVGFHGVMSIFVVGLILYALRFVPLGRSRE